MAEYCQLRNCGIPKVWAKCISLALHWDVRVAEVGGGKRKIRSNCLCQPAEWAGLRHFCPGMHFLALTGQGMHNCTLNSTVYDCISLHWQVHFWCPNMHIAEYNCKMSVRAILHNRWSTSLRSKDGFQKISTGAQLIEPFSRGDDSGRGEDRDKGSDSH